jgi:hypothetical protein
VSVGLFWDNQLQAKADAIVLTAVANTPIESDKRIRSFSLPLSLKAQARGVKDVVPVGLLWGNQLQAKPKNTVLIVVANAPIGNDMRPNGYAGGG